MGTLYNSRLSLQFFFFCIARYYSAWRTSWISISIKIQAVKLGKGQKQHQAEHNISLTLVCCWLPVVLFVMINKSVPALRQNVFHTYITKRPSTVGSVASPENRVGMSHYTVVSLMVIIWVWMLQWTGTN
jgi:hypothetical protein